MNEAVDAHTGQPRTGGALGGCDLTMRPVMTDALSRRGAHEGMVRAEDLGRQLRDLPPDLVQLPLLIVQPAASAGQARRGAPRPLPGAPGPRPVSG